LKKNGGKKKGEGKIPYALRRALGGKGRKKNRQEKVKGKKGGGRAGREEKGEENSKISKKEREFSVP